MDIQRKALAEYQRTAEARLRALFGIGIHTTFKRLPGFANKLHLDGKAVCGIYSKDVAATKVAVGKIQTILNQTGSHATIRAGETSIVSAKKLRGLTFNAETMVYFDKAFTAAIEQLGFEDAKRQEEALARLLAPRT